MLGLVLILAPSITALADNTEDLLNVYGLTLGGPVKSEIEKQLDILQSNLNAMTTQQGMDIEYNAMLAEYIESREKFIDALLADVSVYQDQNRLVSDYIGSNILSADISDLVKADAKYKTNVSYIDELMSSLNDYKINYTYKSVQYNLDDIESRLEETQQLYVESLDTFDLGKVKDIPYVMPVNRIINSQYGYRQDPLSRGTIRFHAGVDYRAAEGTEIYALFNGIVISCGWSNAIGNFVVVQSGDNVKYMVCHCSALDVVDGQTVKQGDLIAFVGGTGTQCTGPHLHLALYLNGVSYDVDRLFK